LTKKIVQNKEKKIPSFPLIRFHQYFGREKSNPENVKIKQKDVTGKFILHFY
jgi:hypothetical protein